MCCQHSVLTAYMISPSLPSSFTAYMPATPLPGPLGKGEALQLLHHVRQHVPHCATPSPPHQLDATRFPLTTLLSLSIDA